MELTQRGVRAYLPTFEINDTYTVVNIFTRWRIFPDDRTTDMLWLVLWKDPSQHGGQPLFRCCCPARIFSHSTPQRVIPANLALLASGRPIPWKWKHIYITPRPVYRAESRLERQNLVSRLSLNGEQLQFSICILDGASRHLPD